MRHETDMADPPILPLTLTGVTYRAGGQTLVDNISARLEAGQRSVILGPNGAGKSLLLRLCHGLLQPTAGRVDWAAGNGERVRRRQAMVFQDPVLLRRSAAGNIRYPLRLRGVPARERQARVTEALARAGLSAMAAVLPVVDSATQALVFVLTITALELILLGLFGVCLVSDRRQVTHVHLAFRGAAAEVEAWVVYYRAENHEVRE